MKIFLLIAAIYFVGSARTSEISDLDDSMRPIFLATLEITEITICRSGNRGCETFYTKDIEQKVGTPSLPTLLAPVVPLDLALAQDLTQLPLFKHQNGPTQKTTLRHTWTFHDP